MKKYLFLFFLVFFLLSQYQIVFAQCKEFSEQKCKSYLQPYIHDGVYNATVLSQGEMIELNSVFYKNQEYRLLVCSEDTLLSFDLTVLDEDRNVLFNNKEKTSVKYWDFKIAKNQMLTLVISANKPLKGDVQCVTSCVSVLYGYLYSDVP